MTFPDTENFSQEPVQQQAEQETGNQSPWAPYMEDLPESVRPLVEPIFKKWDGDVTQRFQKVHSEYEPLKGFQEVLQNGWELNDVQDALRLAAAINENPQAVYEAFKSQFEAAQPAEQGQQGNQQDFGFAEDELPPAIKKELEELRIAQQQISGVLTAQQEAQQQQIAEQQVNQIFDALHNAYGEFDDGYVAYLMYNGVDPNQAVAQAQQLRPTQAPQQQQNVPVVMGSGGGLPSQAVNPSQMTEQERKAFVAEMVKQAAEASREP